MSLAEQLLQQNANKATPKSNLPVVYFAGKCSALESEDWHGSVWNTSAWNAIKNHNTMRDHWRGTLLQNNNCMASAGWKFIRPDGMGLIYGGPTYIVCEHAKQYDDHECDHNCMPRDGTPDRCYRQICQSDAVFAYIESPDAYGTLLELGFAIAHRKPIYIQYAEDFAPEEWADDEWWFLDYSPKVKCYSASYYDTETHTVKLRSLPFLPDEILRMASWEERKEWYRNTYLYSAHWKAMRCKALEFAKERCQLCNKFSSLQVHHRTYENLGNEELSDLIVLCRDCHSKFHNIPK